MTKSGPPGNKVIFEEFDHYNGLSLHFSLKFGTNLAAIMSHDSIN